MLLEYGTHDQLFPFERVAIPMREKLERMGYAVNFRVDQGGRHWPSGDFQPEALDWFFSEAWRRTPDGLRFGYGLRDRPVSLVG